MTCRTTRQFIHATNLVLSKQFIAQLWLVNRKLPGHVENLLARPQMLLRVAMTLQAPAHQQRAVLIRERHQIDGPVTFGAADSLIYMNAVVEVDELRQVMNSLPGDCRAGAKAGPHRRKRLGAHPDLLMAINASLGRWNPREGRRFDRSVAVATIDP